MGACAFFMLFRSRKRRARKEKAPIRPLPHRFGSPVLEPKAAQQREKLVQKRRERNKGVEDTGEETEGKRQRRRDRGEETEGKRQGEETEGKDI